MFMISRFNDICVNYLNEHAASAIKEALLRGSEHTENIAFLFIGTDANVGDSLAPMVGSLINDKGLKIFTYGNLNCTITAKDVPYICSYVKNVHPQSAIIVVDAAVGKKEDLGNVRVMQKSIRPGLGVDKILPAVGDLSIIGVVAERSQSSLAALGYAKISDVYTMAKVIAEGINGFIEAKITA